ncbi:MAG TPA: lipocalin-like domain-containing protein [Humisphaera sp.]|nr:lipocalin-like domain-containing protein [Humisphaera sp.]
MFSQATSPRDWKFPRDHGRHDGFKTEWWYFTGNLSDDSGRKFGYQLTFFRTAIAPVAATRPSQWAFRDLYFAHAAISDVTGQTFVFKDRMSRGRTGLAESSDKTLDVRLFDWKALLDQNAIHLQANEDSFSIDLSCTGGRAPILQGPGGINAKGRKPEQASYYYSMTRLQTTGILTLGGRQFHVKGQTWMDHEFSSNALSPEQTGWDWFGLSLADGNDLMIYRLRSRTGADDFLSGTLIKPDGTPRYLSAADISLESSKPWVSPASGAAYPQQWAVSVRGLPKFVVRSRIPGQELITSVSTKVDYFEGTAEVLNEKGNAIGEGYLEMTGYGKSLGGF